MSTVNENEAHEVELLLPWHAAGTLSQRDTQRVETALAGDPELARRYELVREELGETIHLNETLGAPSAGAMAVLFAEIDAEPARAPAISLNLGARLREFFASLSPRTLAWSASAAAIAIVLQAGLIAGIMFGAGGPGRVNNNYATASVPVSAVGEGSYALVRFQPSANAADISKFLENNRLSLAGGPTGGGLFRVQVASKKLSQSDLAGIIKKLQEDKVVGFVAAMN